MFLPGVLALCLRPFVLSSLMSEKHYSDRGYMHPPCACGARDVLEMQVQLVTGTLGDEWSWIR